MALEAPRLVETSCLETHPSVGLEELGLFGTSFGSAARLAHVKVAGLALASVTKYLCPVLPDMYLVGIGRQAAMSAPERVSRRVKGSHARDQASNWSRWSHCQSISVSHHFQ